MPEINRNHPWYVKRHALDNRRGMMHNIFAPNRPGGYFTTKTKPDTKRFYKYFNVTKTNNRYMFRLKDLRQFGVKGSYYEDIGAYVAKLGPNPGRESIDSLEQKISRVISRRKERGMAALDIKEKVAIAQRDEALRQIDKREKYANKLVDKVKTAESVLIEAKQKGYVDTKTKHKTTTIKQSKPDIKPQGNIGQNAIRHEIKQNAKSALSKNVDVLSVSGKNSAKLSGGTKAGNILKNLAGNRWLRRGAIGLGIMFALSKVRNMINPAPSPSLPNRYDNTYDMIKESTTDFGSPLKLWKTASKVLIPYKSSVRKCVRTTVRQELESNLSLKLAANAIKHTYY
jgi:hypothetical protein